jgi:hypothetical protein
MNNLGLRQAKQQIGDFINGLPFDIEVKRLLVKDIYEDIRAEADKVVIKELSEAQKALKESEDGGQE